MDTYEYNEKYFRPSKFPAINIRDFNYNFIDKFSNENPTKLLLPNYLFSSPKDTIINYFSILREAESVSNGGCGSIGLAKSPYPISYNFYTQEFKNKTPYEKYLSYFVNIGHINLIKLHKIPNKYPNNITSEYFIEIEVIENLSENKLSFGYYYGFISIKNENDKYLISNIELNREDFLCAAYHGWIHNAEMYVDATYGNWCNLIKERHNTEQIYYIKNIYAADTNLHEYKFTFFELTNGTDIPIEQFILDDDNHWIPIEIDVYKCINNK